MVKIKFSFLFILFSIINLHGQVFSIDSTISNSFQKKKLSLDEANILSSYYTQDGNNSAVTGGIGTEKLNDFANVFDIKFSKTSAKGIKSTYGLEMGVDYYTSASSDNIDTRRSSASSEDVRFYPSINYNRLNEKTKAGYGANLAFSKEYDYTSYGGGVNYSKSFNNDNTELGLKANVYFDQYQLILPIEFRSGGGGRGREFSPRNTYDFGISLSQIASPKFQMAFVLDLNYQSGYLQTPFHRVYKADGSKTTEVLPDSRFKLPVGARANYYVNDRFIIRTFYRYYMDDWGLKGHTAQIETPIRLNSKWTVSPYYRFYNQSGIDYFYAYKEAPVNSQYHSSDYDLSKFTSHYYGTGVRYTPFKSLKFMALQSIELRFGKYDRSTSLDAMMGAIHVQFKGF